MDLGIKGRTAIVCASSRGLGKACAIALAEAGVSLVLNGRDQSALESTANEIVKKTGVGVIPVIADISSQEGQAKVLEACATPDILVNNNGGPPFKDFRELDRDAMLDGVTMNMVTPIELIQKVVDHMISQQFGRIINITSMSVKMPVPGLDLSSVARAGLTAFLAGVSRTIADQNVTVNNILPGFFDTDRLRGGLESWAKNNGAEVEQVAKDRMSQIPAKRFGVPDEFGQTCAFLCSAHAGYITGQSLLIDGGVYNSAF